METADNNIAAEAFSAEAGVTPAVVSTDADAPAATPLVTEDSVKPSKSYSDDDLARVRTQEKDKLYPQIEKWKSEAEELRKQLEAQEAAKQAEKEALDAEARAKAEAEMDVRDLLKQKESEFNEQLERERQERERAFALLDKEKSLADLQSFRQQTLETERENIIPELLDLVSGNTREEVAQSIESLKERSAKILESAQAAMQNTRREMTGTKTTLPPAGPLDINSEQRNFTAEEIAAMPMNDYAKYRQRLLSDKAQGRGQGLFGN
jgi:DNA repair exonuclease SbcCD ATPase subunit